MCRAVGVGADVKQASPASRLRMLRALLAAHSGGEVAAPLLAAATHYNKAGSQRAFGCPT